METGRKPAEVYADWRGLVEPETRLKESSVDGKMFVFDMQRFAKGKPWIDTPERLHIGIGVEYMASARGL